MDGFFLSIFLAVCIVVAVLIRCICYRVSCIRHLITGGANRPSGDVILPRDPTSPIITPARANAINNAQAFSVDIPDSPTILPQHGAVFTIYTFPQQPSPVVRREHQPPRTPEPPKYSSLPQDSPPKYEDLFPLADFSLACKTTNISSSSSAPSAGVVDSSTGDSDASSPTTATSTTSTATNSTVSSLATNATTTTTDTTTITIPPPPPSPRATTPTPVSQIDK